MLRICAYEQEAYSGRLADKQAKGKLGNYLVGLRVIKDSLQRAGYTVDWADALQLRRYNVVLVSITSDRDWLPFIAERLKWPQGVYKVIVGGPGVANVRPFLEFADCFVLGRGENLIVNIIHYMESGEQYIDESVIWSDQFSMDKTYRFRQEPLYPHFIELERGGWNESNIGCPYKCRFCAYTHHRRHTGGGVFATGGQVFKPSNLYGDREFTMMDLISGKRGRIGALNITALDGFSERLRKMVNKPISRDGFREFLRLVLQEGRNYRFKMYNIVGLPTECEDDYAEFMEDIEFADKRSRWSSKVTIELQCTPFRATPVTPAACWPMAYKDHRDIAKLLRAAAGVKTFDRAGTVYDGKHLNVFVSRYTESLSTTALAAICIRGTESDSRNIKRLAERYDEFVALDSRAQLALLQKGFDLITLFGAYTPEDLPTRNIQTYTQIIYAN